MKESSFPLVTKNQKLISGPFIVAYKRTLSKGGNVVLVLSPKWRFHYYAHLDTVTAKLFSLVNQQSIIGKVGATGNAAGKPPHLHYTIKNIIPYPWQMDTKAKQRWKKMFYINPIPFLNQSIPCPLSP